VVTAMPNYPSRRIDSAYRGTLWRTERRGGVAVHRSWLRVRPEEGFVDKALYELTFTVFSLPRIVQRLRVKDVVVCVVPSLGAAMAGAAIVRALELVRRRPRLVLWVQDLVVAAAESVPALGSRARRVLAAARSAEVAAAKAADRLVVCSPGFRDYFRDKGIDSAKIDIVLNWVDVDWIAPVGLSRADAYASPTRFLYAGNIGYTQGFETLVDACRLAGPSVEAVIVGDGNAVSRVRALAASTTNVEVRPPVPRAEFPALLASADVHVVLQRRVSAGANLPSKIATYLSSGRAVIASIDANTPAGGLLRASGGAILVEPEDAAALARAMTLLTDRRSLRDELARRGRAFAKRELSREAALARLENAFLCHSTWSDRRPCAPPGAEEGSWRPGGR
jgi:colanic acid biosynthesis glycosyl transferase WcaI